MKFKDNPYAAARWDAEVEGYNENPYPKGSHEWEEYEITFDEVLIKREREDASIGI